MSKRAAQIGVGIVVVGFGLWIVWRSTFRPTISVELLDYWPSDRMVFNRFKELHPHFPHTKAHTQAKLRIHNYGRATLNVWSIVATGPFSMVSPAKDLRIAPRQAIDVTVQFDGGDDVGLKTGNLIINCNDRDARRKVIKLVGFHQKMPEEGYEPPLPLVVNGLFGFRTNIVGDGQLVANGGKREAIGDEILSAYWRRADPKQPVKVWEISANRTQDKTAVLRWYPRGTESQYVIFTASSIDSQSIHPRQEDKLTEAAWGTFAPPPDQSFGFRIDHEWADNEKNVQEKPGGGYGHHVRFYPLKTVEKGTLPNTYLMVMDYDSVNFDYNDNVCIIANIRPENTSVPATTTTTKPVG